MHRALPAQSAAGCRGPHRALTPLASAARERPPDVFDGRHDRRLLAGAGAVPLEPAPGLGDERPEGAWRRRAPAPLPVVLAARARRVACEVSPRRAVLRVQLVREEGRDVSS